MSREIINPPSSSDSSVQPLKKRTSFSLAIKIFNIYLLLTFSNLLFIWLITGANHVSLINKNALLKTRLFAETIVHDLEKFKVDTISNKLKLSAAIEDLFKSHSLLANIKSYTMVDSTGVFILPASKEGKKISEKKLRYVYNAIQLFDLEGKKYLGNPNIYKFLMEIYIPIRYKSNTRVLKVEIPMTSIKKEVKSLIWLALVMLALIILLQTIFGYFIYRILVKPIRRLADAAELVGEGDLNVSVKVSDSHDSIGMLTTVFNGMVSSLKEKTEKLTSTIDKLELHDRRTRHELLLAQEIQSALMPKNFSNIYLSIVTYLAPLGKVSGDYYDIFELQDNKTGILLADITGHGVPAALISMMAKVNFASLADRCDNAAELFSKVNTKLVNIIPTSDFVTAVYLMIDSEYNVNFSSAGAPEVLYFSHKESKVSFLKAKGVFLGAFDDENLFTNHQLKAHAKDLFVLYSDGITEIENEDGEMFGKDRLADIISEKHHIDLNELKFLVIEAINEFLGTNVAKDDQSLLIVRLN